MSFHDLDGLRYYSFEIFSDTLTQAVFTRRGGVSPAPWHSLNLGGAVGDDPAHVVENRLRLFSAMRRSPASMRDVWLVHSTDIIYADSLRPLDTPTPKADIIFTNNPNVSLFMRFGDCVPILFHDPVKKVIGIAHAGWLGTLRGVVGSAARGMQSHYGCDPKNIVAWIITKLARMSFHNSTKNIPNMPQKLCKLKMETRTWIYGQRMPCN